ncbi:MAG: prolipoprotein diacylglyceryl transferase [Prevotellaceae bacterium]|jgi:prolipoprotein diacylglyceryl transferase|nr:prolipoprotein diacylglyceryl transferase [Prevotellaceae bacterium]
MLLSITWNIDPEIFSIGIVHVRYYGVLFALAFVCDYLIFSRFFRREKLPLPLLDALTMWAVIFTIVGLRLGHCLFYEPAHYLSHPWDMLKIWEGGLASHGAAIALPLGLWLFCRKHKMSYLWLLDRIVIVVALTGFFIRIGNLMNSEIYGIQTSLPWGFIFEHRHELAPKHPTQIYEALAYLLIFLLLLHIYVKKDSLRRRGGFLFGAFLTLVFTFRFLVEFIKERQVDFEEGMPLDMGQLLSIPFVLLGVFMLIYSLRREPDSKPFVLKLSDFQPNAGAKAQRKGKSKATK